MKFSVIIPAYNAEKYIKKCINSVLCQEYNDIEIIVINDGSSDNTGEICKEFEKKNANVLYFSQENMGQSVARNIGIKHATGDYIIFLDADDYMSVGSIEKICSKLEEECFDAITFNVGRYDEYGKKIENITPKGIDEKLYLSGYDYIIKYGYTVPVVAWMWILRREFILENNFSFMEGRLCEDVEWTAKWFPYAKKIGYINAELYCQVLASGSTMRSKNLKRSKDLMYIASSVYENTKKLGERGMNDIQPAFFKYASEEAFASFHSAITMGFKIADLENEEKFEDTIELVLYNKKYILLGYMLKYKFYFLFEFIVKIYDLIRRNR